MDTVENHPSCLLCPLNRECVHFSTAKQQAHLSQAVFARYLNLTVGDVSQLERGTRHPKGAPHEHWMQADFSSWESIDFGQPHSFAYVNGMNNPAT